MLRHTLVALIGLAVVVAFAQMGDSNTDRAAYALIAFSAGLGALAYPAWLRRRRKPVTKRSVFVGTWAASVLLPLLITMVDGSSSGFVGEVVGSALVIGAIIAAILASLYAAAYERIRNCPECDELVSARAKVCKHCKRDIVWPTHAVPS